MKKVFKITGFVFLGIISIALILLLGLHVISPGKTTPLVKPNGNPYMNGLALMEMQDIGGVEQSLILRSKDVDNPVLLYVHGGPGSPEFPFIQHFQTDLEEYFTVCYWDQRGAGLSWSKDIPVETMTLGQFIEDTRQVTELLIERFDKEKIYIMGHSWGTLLSSHVIHKYPELYHAYFGIGQVNNQLRSEQISYDFALEEASKRNDEKAIEKLQEIGRPPYGEEEEWLNAVMIERKYVGKYGGAMKEGDFMKEAVTAIINCREYRLKDKLSYMKANNESLKHLWYTVIEADLARQVPSQEIPVYIFQGKYDYQTCYEVAKEYFDVLEAPVKEFYTFENSAHSPNFEEKEKFEKVIGDILKSHQTSLSILK
ncbi:MAG: alpha/beta fold hydrolase [Bacteroidales bacterium]